MACDPDKGSQALNVRTLQSHLMVAGLSCGQSAQYNQFVGQYQKELVNHGQSLKAYFNRTYGGAGRRELNAYVTRMANEASRRSMVDRRAFCQESLTVFQTLESQAQTTLVSYIVAAAPFAIQPEGCPTRTAQRPWSLTSSPSIRRPRAAPWR
ncbi:MAG: hypothetical protein K9H11_09480 [Rhodospirillum sp.]|nr:hypothetical protein [Rhodospirillum sp.]